MGRLGPLTSQGLGRSPYDDTVPGQGNDYPPNQYAYFDDRGRLYNPVIKGLNRDFIRSHNEVMMVIGVAEPESGTAADAQMDATHRQNRFEDVIGSRLHLAAFQIASASNWAVHGIRQRLWVYQPYSQTTFYGMFRMARRSGSFAPYFLAGFPSFLAATSLELVSFSRKEDNWFWSAMTYIRIHLAIYVFFQRIEIIPFNHWLPNWRFFIPGSSLSPISLPPPPASFRPGSLLPWLGACALGTAPFLCFYLSSRVHANLAKNLRDAIYKHLPRPDNSFLRRQTWAGLRLGTPNSPADPRADEGVSTSPTGPPPLRRQSTVSLRGSGINNDVTTATTTTAADHGGGGSVDEFGSDDEETEIISATLISFDVEAADPTTPGASGPGGSTAPNGAVGGDTTPGIWSAELRPNIPDNSRSSGYGTGTGSINNRHESVYRENAFTALPARLAANILALTPARLMAMPMTVAVHVFLARSYMRRMGMSLDIVNTGAGFWFGMQSARGLVNLLGLELLLGVLQAESWAAIMLVANRWRYTEEEWMVREVEEAVNIIVAERREEAAALAAAEGGN
ncbi:uncharacterized protein C8A04DRAFT_9193 [Dichotomopilus funicola]|uniref:Uncharacterized protein n=1 Tax=Dichotomopilus funicola TaxID=1934379 RepID=A0AAN6VA62_9PEZI|nr:hypothetical protein C8A04DRAFT_9193 [Dichotomopilus funicola]